MKQDFRQIIRHSKKNLLLGRIIAWGLDAIVISFLSIVAFATWSYGRDPAFSSWVLFSAVLSVVLAVMLILQAQTGTSMQEVARQLDDKLGFKDRLSSAVVFSNSENPTEFMLEHMKETNAFLEKKELAVLPIPRPRRAKAYILLLAIVLVSILPHEDRKSVWAVEKRARIQKRKHAAMKISEELRDIKGRADLAGLRKLGNMLKEVNRAISEQMDILRPREPTGQPNGRTAPRSSGENTKDQSNRPLLRDISSTTSEDKPRLSRVASYRPVGRFDSFPDESYSEAFDELDNLIISDDFLTSRELLALSNHIDDVAGKLGNFGYFKDEQASKPQSGPGPRYGRMGPVEPDNPFNAGLAPLQYKAFSEFLKRYAAHLGEKALGMQHRQEMAENKAGSRGKFLDVSKPPSGNGKFSFLSTSQNPPMPLIRGTQQQVMKVASQVRSAGKATTGSDSDLKVTGGGTRPGGKGAGSGGGGDSRATAIKTIPKASGGDYLPLEGKLSDGRSVIQIIDARAKKRLGGAKGPESEKITYNEIFNEYARGAQAELAGESVPVQMRDYIRQYFLSIRPEAKKQ